MFIRVNKVSMRIEREKNVHSGEQMEELSTACPHIHKLTKILVFNELEVGKQKICPNTHPLLLLLI